MALREWDRATVQRGGWLALAAWLSFAVAACLHVHNAYWAAMPVWVISQSSRGVLVERALFRVIGTVVGAAVGFALVNLPVTPYLQLLLLAGWIAGNAGLTHILRGVRGYAALLAGMTAAIVVIPSLLEPSGSMSIAMARVDCTLIGVIVSTLVMAFSTPEAPLAEFYSEVRAVSAQAVAYAAHVLQGQSPDDGSEERRILGLISHLESTARLHAAGSVEGYRRQADVDRLVLGSLSTMAAAQAAGEGHSRYDADLLKRLQGVAEHLRTAPTQPLAVEEHRIPSFGDPTLMRLDAAIGDILAAEVALFHPNLSRTFSPDPRSSWLAPHREWSLALHAGGLAGGASLVASALALWMRSPVMGLAALGVCIFVMVLGSLPLPQLVAPKLLIGVLMGALAGTFYRLSVQPVIGSTSGLLLTLVPFMLLGGFARAYPPAGAAGVDSNMCFLLTSQAGMPASYDTAGIIQGSTALAMSACVMAGLFILLPRQARRQAVDAASMIRRDLQRILESGDIHDPVAWRARSSRQILRLALHLGRAKDLGKHWPKGLLASINLGQAMIDLQGVGIPEPVKVLLTATLQQRISPTQASDALRALALSEADDQTKELTLRLSETLGQATGLLRFALYPNPNSSLENV